MQDLTIKQEKFCRAFVGPADGNASEAYRIAYNSEKMKPSTVNRKAKELMDNGKIAATIKSYKEEAAAQNAITIEEITGGLRRVATAAAGAGQHSAAAQALVALAKLGGLMIEKRALTVDDQREHLDAVANLAAMPAIEKEKEQQDRVTHWINYINLQVLNL